MSEKAMLLINKDLMLVQVGDTVPTFKSETAKLTGARPPDQPGSTGILHVTLDGKHIRDYFPPVCGLKWTTPGKWSMAMLDRGISGPEVCERVQAALTAIKTNPY